MVVYMQDGTGNLHIPAFLSPIRIAQVCYAEGRPCCEGVGDWAEHWFCRRPVGPGAEPKDRM